MKPHTWNGNICIYCFNVSECILEYKISVFYFIFMCHSKFIKYITALSLEVQSYLLRKYTSSLFQFSWMLYFHVANNSFTIQQSALISDIRCIFNILKQGCDPWILSSYHAKCKAVLVSENFILPKIYHHVWQHNQ